MSASKPTLPTTCTSLLDLDNPVLSLIAEKGFHQELRSTCKHLQQICDSCRTRLLIVDLPSAENSLKSLSQWPRLTCFCILRGSVLDEWLYPTRNLTGPTSLLTAILGRQLRRLELHGLEVKDSLLALVLKQCRATLRALQLSEVQISSGKWQESSHELQKCELKSLSIDGVSYRFNEQGLWSTKLVSGPLGSHLQDLEIDLAWENNDTSEEWQEAGKRLKNLKALSLRSCDCLFAEYKLGSFLAGCTQVRKLDVGWYCDCPCTDSSNVLFAAAAHCPHLESLAVDGDVSPAALMALPAGQCQALRHVKVTVNVWGLSNMDEVGEGLSSLTSVEHLELAIRGPPSRELLEALERGLLALRKLKYLNFLWYSCTNVDVVIRVYSFIWALPAFEIDCCVHKDDAETVRRLVDIVDSPAKLTVTRDDPIGHTICRLSKKR